MMLSTLRPATSRIFRQQGLRCMTVISKESGEEYQKMNYTSRMKKMGRPVSPHVLIYAFPMAAITSITNRVTGVALSVGAAGLGAIELFGGGGTSLALMQFIGSQGFLIAAGAKFVVAFPVVYHYFGAVRHFAWDYMPQYLNNVDVEKSSSYLIAASLAVSGGLMFV